MCTSVGAAVKKPKDGVNVAQRKKNLGLLTAAYVGHNDCMQVFVGKGADVNCADKDFDWHCRRKLCRKMGFASEANYMKYDCLECFTPLISAAVHSCLESIKLLVKAGANVNLVKKRRTALGAAAEKGNDECVELFIELGANVNFTDRTIRPALMCAIHAKSTSAHIKCIEILIKSGADINTIYSNRYTKSTPLEEAADNSTPEVASLLIKAGADVNMGTTVFPLYLATQRGKFQVAKVLTDAGADVNKRNSRGETALHAVFTFFSQGCFNLMLKSGADVNISTNEGVTPLMRAARACWHLQQMKIFEMTVLQIKNEKVRSIKRICRLLKVGAQIGRRDHMGKNSLEYSMEQNQKNVREIQMLLYAAGETLDGPTVTVCDRQRLGVLIDIDIPEYFQEQKENLDLKHLCREAIRKHLIDLDPHQHLFGRIPQLGLPSIVTEYLLYDCSLDYRRAADCENDTD